MLNKLPNTAAVDSSGFMALNAMSFEEFTARLADVFEYSPWVAQRVGCMRPFEDVSQFTAMVSP